MSPLPVVEDLDILEERGAGFVMRPKGLAGEQFALEGGDIAFLNGALKYLIERDGGARVNTYRLVGSVADDVLKHPPRTRTHW
jgi:hypothetical protein